jgi:DNA-binding transcriptional ArsR family regulator
MVIMASTTDMLQTTLGETAYTALGVLAGSQTPMSGRMVATALGVAPSTATAVLGKLREAGFATSSREGRADRWHLNTDSAVLRSWLEETRGEPSSAKAPAGMSPYPTGGGGVTFERKVAVQYLAHLLVGDGAVELGDGQCVVSVAFQQAPEHSVDDLVIRAARVGESEPSLVLAVGVRRTPDLVQSDESTRKLIRTFVHEVINAPADGPEQRVALVVAGTQDHTRQLAWLADLASKQMDAPSFFGLVRTPNKFPAAFRGRLDQIEALVGLALIDLGVADPGPQIVQQRTWELLSRLTVLMPRLETPDDADWAAVTNALIPVARGADLYGASRLRDRLVALANEYPPTAATVDLSLLRRDTHEVLDATTRRHRRGWAALDHLHARAIASVRDEISSSDGSRAVHVDRSDAAAELLAVPGPATLAVVAHGDSGVGKSALVVGALTGAVSNDPDITQALCINLRHLPTTTLELESILVTPLATLLTELSAPTRLLVIDGADAISEGKLEPFRYLVDAGLQTDMLVIAVTASDTKQLVRDAIAERSGGNVAEYLVPPLTDPQVDDVVATFAELAALAINPRSRELLRRPVVVDLLVRGGLAGTPLSDADAMRQVWSGLVRRHEQADRGTPDARQLALLRLADLALCGGDALNVVGSIDPTALDGLRHDGLLRASLDDPFRIGPEFAHDEVRRYAVARLILAGGNPISKLVDAGVPRWALGAARIACQALLAEPDTPANPLHGRFARLQEAFDHLVDAGHGDRWGDVPGEALLTLGDPDPVLRDAWPKLRAEPGAGLQRLSRLVDQRLRDEKGLVRTVAVEPLINMLLDDETPWSSGEHLQELLRDWLRALVIADTSTGYPLRLRLRDRLVAACAAADRRLQGERDAAAAARAARSAEEIEKESEFLESHRALFTEIGYPRRRRRARREVPVEITDDIMVELLALLGPDLSGQGETVLRRVAQEAPAWLGPAVEKVFTGRALATYGRGFLAELTEAYYLDDDEDGSGFHEDGISHHDARSFGVTPLAAWYRGPFMPLLQSDFRNGVAVLNRMLNHAALARARTLAGLHNYGAPIDDSALDAYRTEFEITGTRRVYVGDGHVWTWYRGTGVGPYPCMSALQALERVCDQLIEIGIPIANIVATLLDGCENLAMVGLVVGLLVRHLEEADRLLDPYLAAPIVWRHEFSRVVSESSGLAAPSDGLAQAERRRWSLREAVMLLVLRADDSRVDELRSVGQQLVATARRLIVEALGDDGDEALVEEQLVTVRAWASGFDRATYEAHEAEDGIFIQSRPSDDIAQAMQRGNEEVQRTQEATRLLVRYYVQPRQGTAEPISAEGLAADLAVAQDLLENPPALNPGGQWDAPLAVAATALEAQIVSGVELPIEAMRFAVEAVLRVGAGEASPRQFEFEESYFEQGADRSAARVLPLLLLPNAATLRAVIDAEDGSETYSRSAAAAGNIARFVANEVRVHLARGLDRVWEAPCTNDGTCHHGTALQLAIETMRDCAFGAWDPDTGRRRVMTLADPVAQSLADTADDAIYFSRLDGAIRALAPAAQAGVCVSERARHLLAVLVAAQRRSLLSYEHDMDHRGTHALIAARALLTIAADGDDLPIYEHIDAYADNTVLLSGFLRALSAAAEESSERAETARRIWPSLVSHIIGLHESGRAPFHDGHYGEYALASLMPNVAGEVSFLYREVEKDPLVWWEPLAWQSSVAQWLPFARGTPTCVDQLIGFVAPVGPEDQARVGLPWVASLVLADPGRVANRTFLLSSWLIEVRPAASDAGVLSDWQRVVDALVVAGVSRLAPYSE